MICARCEDGDHKECTDGEPRELGGVVLCDCATDDHKNPRFEGYDPGLCTKHAVLCCPHCNRKNDGCARLSPADIASGTLTCNGKFGHKGKHHTFWEGRNREWD